MNISIIAFAVLILVSIGLFAKNAKTIIRNINLGKDLLEISKNIDFSELCITSSAIVQKSNTEEVTTQTIKAEGDKCPVCWKISREKCVRHSN